MTGKFIKTKDKDTANFLRSRGFTTLGESCGVFTFFADGILRFDEEEQIHNKVIYTDIMTF